MENEEPKIHSMELARFGNAMTRSQSTPASWYAFARRFSIFVVTAAIAVAVSWGTPNVLNKSGRLESLHSYPTGSSAEAKDFVRCFNATKTFQGHTYYRREVLALYSTLTDIRALHSAAQTQNLYDALDTWDEANYEVYRSQSSLLRTIDSLAWRVPYLYQSFEYAIGQKTTRQVDRATTSWAAQRIVREVHSSLIDMTRSTEELYRTQHADRSRALHKLDCAFSAYKDEVAAYLAELDAHIGRGKKWYCGQGLWSCTLRQQTRERVDKAHTLLLTQVGPLIERFRWHTDNEKFALYKYSTIARETLDLVDNVQKPDQCAEAWGENRLSECCGGFLCRESAAAYQTKMSMAVTRLLRGIGRLSVEPL